MDELKPNGRWRIFRTTLRETVVIVVVSALAIGVFFGVIRVMSPDNSSQEAVAPQSAETTPPPLDSPAT